MSRSTKWKLDNTKVKVVFRLQFHATHIPPSGWDKLFITFISFESGKATAKTTKANVRNGTCKWTDPIYETTRLLQDSKSKQYEEKIYKLVIAMGSSRATILGETTINLAEFADALKPCIISLPLYGCDFGTTLHVTVQLLTSKTGFREFEQQREFMEKGLQSDQANPDDFSGGKFLLNEGLLRNQEVSRSRAKEKLKELNPNEEDPALTSNAASNASESQYDEKHELNTSDLTQFTANQRQDVGDSRFPNQGTSDWVRRWTSESSGDTAIAAAYEENAKLRGCLKAAELSIIELKSEIDSLQSDADHISKEAHLISSQLSSEISSGLELADELSVLKSELSKFSAEFEEFKVSSSYHALEQQQTLQVLRRGWANGIAILEEKALDIRNKSSLGYREMDYPFPLTDLDAMLVVLQNLKQECVIKTSDNLGGNESDQFRYDLDMYQPDLRSGDSKTFHLLQEMAESKTENISLKNKMDQMECYYEALVQELEENQKQLIFEFQNLKDDHSASMYVVSSSKEELEAICMNMNEQIMQLTEDKCDLMRFNEKLEKRATSAESALKRARLNSSIAVNHLQKDLDLLSSQVAAMFETSDGINRRACSISTAGIRVDSKLKEDCDCHFEALYLDVFSTVLKEILKSESANANTVKDEIFNDYFVKMKGESQNLENEKSILSGRVDEYESLVTLYQKKLEDLVEDKTQLTYFLENERVTTEKLEEEVLLLQKELKEIIEKRERSLSEEEELRKKKQTFYLNLLNIDNKFAAVVEKLSSEVFSELFLSLSVMEDELLKIADVVEQNENFVLLAEETLKSSLEFFVLKECFKYELGEKRRLLSDSDTRTIAAEISTAYISSEWRVKADELSEAEDLISELTSWNMQLNLKSSLLEEKLEQERWRFEELRTDYNEVNRKLQEQTLKTEEILSISQRVTEHNREKKEALAGETLRMAFMKEQHETRLGELTQQVTISNRQSEDMLVKLQDMVDEIDERKRSEALLMRKNEELGMHILDLEAELQTFLAEKRANVNACDSLKAEMESQNKQLQLDLEKSRFDLDFLKNLLQKTKPSEELHITNQPDEFLLKTRELNQSITEMIAHVSRNSERNHNPINHGSAVGLKSSIAELTQEVEKMRNDVGLTPHEKFPELRDDLLHLNRANDQLAAIFPLESEKSNNSALKRVLSLEVNIAEQLQSNAAFSTYEETMLRSFVDVNDLIKETLEIKANYATLESELQEMHGRYTELSLKFAEVEGERQKLAMSLKISNRTTKKFASIDR